MFLFPLRRGEGIDGFKQFQIEGADIVPLGHAALQRHMVAVINREDLPDTRFNVR